MKAKYVFVLAVAFLFSGSLFAEIPSADCGSELQSSRPLLNTALHNIYSFPYVRAALADIKSGHPNVEFCSSGILLSKNTYQYPRFYIQILARDAATKAPVQTIHMLFQDASVQALDNFGSKPWIGLPGAEAQAVLDQYVTGLDLKDVGTATNFDPLAVAQTSKTFAACEGQMDKATFGIFPVATIGDKEYYIASWLTLPAGNIFANFPMLKGVLVAHDVKTDSVSMAENLLLTTKIDFPMQKLWDNTPVGALGAE